MLMRIVKGGVRSFDDTVCRRLGWSDRTFFQYPLLVCAGVRVGKMNIIYCGRVEVGVPVLLITGRLQCHCAAPDCCALVISYNAVQS